MNPPFGFVCLQPRGSRTRIIRTRGAPGESVRLRLGKGTQSVQVQQGIGVAPVAEPGCVPRTVMVVGASEAVTIRSTASPLLANVNGRQNVTPIGLAWSPRVADAAAITLVTTYGAG